MHTYAAGIWFQHNLESFLFLTGNIALLDLHVDVRDLQDIRLQLCIRMHTPNTPSRILINMSLTDMTFDDLFCPCSYRRKGLNVTFITLCRACSCPRVYDISPV